MSSQARRGHRRHRLDRNPRRGRYWRTPRPDDLDNGQPEFPVDRKITDPDRRHTMSFHEGDMTIPDWVYGDDGDLAEPDTLRELRDES
jgi:hypothetical protein